MRGTIHAVVRPVAGRIAMAVLAVLALTLTVFLTVPAPSAQAHGWVVDPPSRQDQCSTGAVSHDCQGIEWEPHSVESGKGSMLCSGGSRFTNLDDDSLAWQSTNISSTQNFTWSITARHSTATWEYFVDGQLFAVFDDGGAQPPATLTHTLTGLPSGYHKILARWNVADTANAFYACVDVNVGGGGEEPGGPGDPGDPGEPGECGAEAWSADAAYLGGAQVAHEGHLYRANWWTQGEVPSEAGEWGAWEDLGAC